MRSCDPDRTFSRGSVVSSPRGTGGSDLDSSEVVATLWSVGRFIGHGQGVDKGDEFPFVLPHV